MNKHSVEQMHRNSIAKEVFRLRKEKGINIESMAKLCGVSATYISQVESGVVRPTKVMMDSIFSILGYNVDESLQGVL